MKFIMVTSDLPVIVLEDIGNTNEKDCKKSNVMPVPSESEKWSKRILVSHIHVYPKIFFHDS